MMTSKTRPHPYTFVNWQTGKAPPKGWDCADAIDDGWTVEEIETFMRATVRLWSPPSTTANSSQSDSEYPPVATDASEVDCKNEVRALSFQHEQSSEQDGRKFQLSGMIRFDLELEIWLREKKWQIRRNMLSNVLEVHRPSGIGPVTDDRLSEVRFEFSHSSNGREPAKDKIADALSLIGERHQYHPVLDYLEGLRWDGIKRLDHWLALYTGALSTDLHSAFGRKILCAAVRRVKTPGCKFDHILVLQGPQDLGKSSLIRALCSDPAWFSDQAKVGADAKETIERTAGAWLVELAELDGLGKRGENAVKTFVTTVTDKARLAYGRYSTEKPRQFVLFGTTNEPNFLTDITGNRRWWVAQVAKCDVKGLRSVRDQLWAEAVQYEPCEELWLSTDDLKKAAQVITSAVADWGPWFDLLLDTLPPGPLKITARDAWRLVGITDEGINRISPNHRSWLRKALAGLGFLPKNIRRDGRQVSTYVRGDTSVANWWSPGLPARSNEYSDETW